MRYCATDLVSCETLTREMVKHHYLILHTHLAPGTADLINCSISLTVIMDYRLSQSDVFV